MLGERAGIVHLLLIAAAMTLGGCPRPGSEGPDRPPATAEPSRVEVIVPAIEPAAEEPEDRPEDAGDREEPKPRVPAIDPREREGERHTMVRTQFKGFGRDITDEKTLEAMRTVLRHRLVPDDVQRAAYRDEPLPIGYGQTISQPYMVALMTQDLGLEGGEKVLEIGTGSGYQAAVLAEICKEVYTIEIVEPLSVRATKALSLLGYDNIHTKVGDGYYGWKEHAPFDGIIVTAAASHIPPPLIDQLKDGGRLVIPLGSPVLWQTLTIIEKKGETLETTYSTACRFVPMTGAMEEEKPK